MCQAIASLSSCDHSFHSFCIAGITSGKSVNSCFTFEFLELIALVPYNQGNSATFVVKHSTIRLLLADDYPHYSCLGYLTPGRTKVELDSICFTYEKLIPMSKDWKDSLLSSGIPLEQSLRQTLINLGVTSVSEYTYERFNQEGINTIFSIDNYGKYYPDFKGIHKQRLCIEYFIEAKYATDNKNWIFTPGEFPKTLILQEIYIVLDSLVENLKLKQVNVSKENQDHFCGNGIVIDNKSADRYEIRRGVQQLRYALVNRTLEVIKKQLFGLEDDRKAISVLVPILVTTAKLWRIEQGVSIEDIRNSKDLNEVAKEREYLLLFEPPDNQMIRYNLKLVDEMIREELKGELTLLLKKIVPRLANPYFTNFIEYFYTSMPRVFLICNYNYFHKTISKSINFFQQKTLFVTK